MRRLVPRDTTRPARHVTRTVTVCVVDLNANDYECWWTMAETHDLRLKFFATAEEALRCPCAAAVDLWVINTEVPGLSGFDLCEMLKSQSAAATVWLVADDYSVEAEREALARRASLFAAKPAHSVWLEHWLEHHSRTGQRACDSSPQVRCGATHFSPDVIV